MIYRLIKLLSLSCVCIVFLGATLTGCASSDKDLMKAAEKAKKERMQEQRNRAREADYDLQNSTK